MSREFWRWLGAAIALAICCYGTPFFGLVCLGLVIFIGQHELTVMGKRARSRRRRR